MPAFKLPKEGPLLDVVSLARGRMNDSSRPWTREDLETVRRTVNRSPEVMVKVLSKAGRDVRSVRRHLNYLSRDGELAMEHDGDSAIQGHDRTDLASDWDLEIEALRRSPRLGAGAGREPSKLVHKILFSMPAGIPAEKVLSSVRNLMREKFWGKHRYALVLHTDEPHPHVHVVLKAMSEQGDRLNIKKATLREWRSEFARHLRTFGVAANATERGVRGESRSAPLDGIYRASLRGSSRFFVQRELEVVKAERRGDRVAEAERRTLLKTRDQVVRGWIGIGRSLAASGHGQLAGEVVRFLRGLPPVRTDQERSSAQFKTPVPERVPIEPRMAPR